MKREVVDGNRGHIASQFHPMPASLVAVEEPKFGPEIQHVCSPQVLPHRSQHPIGWKITDNRCPGAAEIGGTKQVVGEIVVPIIVDRYVHGSGGVGRGLDARDPRGCRQPGQPVCEVRPACSSVARHLKIAVVGTGIEQSLLERRLGDRREGRVVGDAVVQRKRRVVRPLVHDEQLAAIDSRRQVAQ